MAHTLSLIGDTTIDLAETTDAGYHFVSFRTPRPNRILERISSFPYGNGERTVASGLNDPSVEIILNIVGTSADDLDSKLQTLVKLLQQAQRWEETRTGTPVRLSFKRQGVTNTAYRVVTGVPMMPEPIDPDEITWLDGSAIMNEMTVSMTLTLEPLAHSGALGVYAPESITLQVGSTDFSKAAAISEMSAPLNIALTRTSAGDAWNEVWMAVCPMAASITEYSGTADADASGGSALVVNASTTATEHVVTAAGTGSTKYDQRVIARIKIHDTDGAFDLKFRVRFTVGSAETAVGYSKTTTYAVDVGHVYTGYYLVDLGRIPRATQAYSHATTVSRAPTIVVEVTTDQFTAVYRLDTIEVVPYLSFVKIKDVEVEDNDSAIYESVAKESTFHWPRRSPTSYVLNAALGLKMMGQLHGTLGPLVPGEVPWFWFQAMAYETPHILADAGDVSIVYQPTYALGLRGNA